MSVTCWTRFFHDSTKRVTSQRHCMRVVAQLGTDFVIVFCSFLSMSVVVQYAITVKRTMFMQNVPELFAIRSAPQVIVNIVHNNERLSATPSKLCSGDLRNAETASNHADTLWPPLIACIAVLSSLACRRLLSAAGSVSKFFVTVSFLETSCTSGTNTSITSFETVLLNLLSPRTGHQVNGEVTSLSSFTAVELRALQTLCLLARTSERLHSSTLIAFCALVL